MTNLWVGTVPFLCLSVMASYTSNRAVSFLGGSDLIVTDLNINSDGAGGFYETLTVEGWVKLRSTAGNGWCMPFTSRSNSAPWRGPYFTSSRVIGIYHANTNALSSGISFNANEWFHFAMVYDSTVVTLYVNGASVFTGTVGVPSGVGGDISFGGINGVAGLACEALFDEVRFWKTARTSEEISANWEVALDGSHEDLLAAYSTMECS